MKRKNSSFYTKCQSHIPSKIAFLRNVTHLTGTITKLFFYNDFYQKVALITNLIVWIAGIFFTVLPS